MPQKQNNASTRSSAKTQSRSSGSSAKTESSKKKKTAVKNTAAANGTSGTRSVRSAAPKEEAALPAEKKPGLFSQITPYLLGVIALFMCICFLTVGKTGDIGSFIRNILFGLAGGGAFAVPVLLVALAVMWNSARENHNLGFKILFAAVIFLSLSAMLHLWTGGAHTFQPAVLWEDGKLLAGGGVIGGLLCELLVKAVGKVGLYIVGLSCLLLFPLFFVGLTPYAVWLRFAYRAHERREATREARAQQASFTHSYILKRKPTPEPSADAPAAEAAPTDRRRMKQAMREQDESVRRAEPVLDSDFDPADDSPRYPEEPVRDERASVVYDMEEDDVVDQDAYDEAMRDADPLVMDEPVMQEPEEPEKKQPDPVVVSESPFSASVEFSPAVSDPEEPELYDEDEPPFDLDDGAPAGKTGAVRHETVRPIADAAAQSHAEPAPTTDQLLDEADGNAVLKRFTEEQKAREEERLARLRESANTDESERLNLLRSPAVPQKDSAEAAPEKPPYVFPPLSFLNLNTEPQNEDISEELHSNAAKLVETLRSFKVRTRIVDISRGPTITRYELVPEEGVRVKAIANLVDDVSLNLATSGVRIEAPIPGKSAVGIEVPNKTVSTVYLRELIDTNAFRSSPSRINVALGADVAGAPVFLDIAKMPHLLIAGATGMGKSVCINSMLVSLLYKANPDEVKLILIDPKKVELNIYNGLPHLLVPVVSDPKRAAGSLQWAVTEMERRFELIEEVGMRDLKGYNQITKDDPEKEFLPQIVIIIDELADLMMTASEDVETSICRLAQKARAAGMHLIIGTQRPSVKVITGLIKANIPSRISFHVTSLVDSRVILDTVGAEKLIGRGDMLYAPVGAMKPIRVQGAFVSEKEIENIVTFIKAQATSEYSSEIIESIERAAAQCGQKKGGISTSFGEAEVGGDNAEGNDPMLRAAIELAVESGKISTSLIQRRLALGYGRAAKLIDTMQEMGIVSAPDGQKPRTVLITKDQYMEMVLRQDSLMS